MKTILFAMGVLSVGAFLSNAFAQDSECVAPAGLDQAKVTLDNANRFRAQRNYVQAQTIVDGVLQRQPRNIRALYQKGLLLADQQKFVDAESVLQRAKSIQEACAKSASFKPDYSLYNTLGYTQLALGKQREAEANLALAVAHSDQLPSGSAARANANLGYLYLTRGQFERARAPLEKASSLGDANATQNLQALGNSEKIYRETRAASK